MDKHTFEPQVYFKVNMEKRIVYPLDENNRILQSLSSQITLLSSTYHEIVYMLEYYKKDTSKYGEALIKECRFNLGEIRKALEIIHKQAEKYNVHIKNNSPEVLDIDKCVENFIDKK